MKTFCNPLEDRDAPDPFMTYDKKTGYYYSLFTCSNRLELYRSRHAADILTDHDSIVLFRAAPENGIYGSIWAPEMHKAPNGKCARQIGNYKYQKYGNTKVIPIIAFK